MLEGIDEIARITGGTIVPDRNKIADVGNAVAIIVGIRVALGTDNGFSYCNYKGKKI